MSDRFDEPTSVEKGPGDETRTPDPNHVTQLVTIEPATPPPFDRTFKRLYEPLQQLYHAFPHDGLLCVAVWNGKKLDNYLHLPVHGDPSYAVIGRHKRCDLRVSRDSNVSLRHVLVGCSPRGNAELRVRLWDLASGIGFHTETGADCEAVMCEGPLFVRLGEYQLFFIPTGSFSLGHWTNSAEETWASFPERILLDQRLPRQKKRAPRPVEMNGSRLPRGKMKDDESVITHIMEPARNVRARQRPETQTGLVVGHIHLATKYAELTYPVTDLDIEFGLLIGRYERCQLGSDENRLSRIHMLMVRDGDDLWAIDTASTNGIEQDSVEVRYARLGSRNELSLANVVKLRWER